MRIIWQVEDGYAGGARSQELEIDDADIEGMTEMARNLYIERAVREEFYDRVSFSWRVA